MLEHKQCRLKSLEGIVSGSMEQIEIAKNQDAGRLKALKCGGGCVCGRKPAAMGVNSSTVVLGHNGNSTYLGLLPWV